MSVVEFIIKEVHLAFATEPAMQAALALSNAGVNSTEFWSNREVLRPHIGDIKLNAVMNALRDLELLNTK